MDTLPTELVACILAVAVQTQGRDGMDALMHRLRLAAVCRLWRTLLDSLLRTGLRLGLPNRLADGEPDTTDHQELPWLLAEQYCRNVWSMTMHKMDEVRPAPIDRDEQKKNVVELLKMARIWSDESSIPSNGDMLDAAFVDMEETDSDIPQYMQQPWKHLQQYVINMLSQLKHVAYAYISGQEHIVVCGPKGSGKTTLVRYLAVNLGLPLIHFECARIKDISVAFGGELGSPILRDLFDLARKLRPCILLLHNAEHLGYNPDTTHSSRVESAALTEVDGLGFREPPVFIIAETSRPRYFSAALARRMRSWVNVGMPDAVCRSFILSDMIADRIGHPPDDTWLQEASSGTERYNVTDMSKLCDQCIVQGALSIDALKDVLAHFKPENSAADIESIKRFDPCFLNDIYLSSFSGEGLSGWNRDGTSVDGSLCPAHHQHLGATFTGARFDYEASGEGSWDEDLYSS